MSKALQASFLSFGKFVVYASAVAMLAAGGLDKMTIKELGIVASVAAFKAALTYVTIYFKEDPNK